MNIIEIISLAQSIFPFIEIQTLTEFLIIYEIYVSFNNIGKVKLGITKFTCTLMMFFIENGDIIIPTNISIGFTITEMLLSIYTCLKTRIGITRTIQIKCRRSNKRQRRHSR